MDKNALLIELSESDQTHFGRIDFNDQTEDQQVFSAIWELESEVNNGGFAKYFANADGNSANFAPTALRRIGANRCADIVARALRTVSPTALPDDQAEREQIIDSLPAPAQDALISLDEAFFAYPDDLTELLFEFVRSNPAVFGTIGEE